MTTTLRFALGFGLGFGIPFACCSARAADLSDNKLSSVVHHARKRGATNPNHEAWAPLLAEIERRGLKIELADALDDGTVGVGDSRCHLLAARGRPTRISGTGYLTVFTYKRLLVSARCVLLHGLQRDHRGLGSTVTTDRQSTQVTGKPAKLADLPLSCA